MLKKPLGLMLSPWTTKFFYRVEWLTMPNQSVVETLEFIRNEMKIYSDSIVRSLSTW